MIDSTTILLMVSETRCFSRSGKLENVESVPLNLRMRKGMLVNIDVNLK